MGREQLLRGRGSIIEGHTPGSPVEATAGLDGEVVRRRDRTQAAVSDPPRYTPGDLYVQNLTALSESMLGFDRSIGINETLQHAQKQVCGSFDRLTEDLQHTDNYRHPT